VLLTLSLVVQEQRAQLAVELVLQTLSLSVQSSHQTQARLVPEQVMDSQTIQVLQTLALQLILQLSQLET
jgi:hypothetical protein